MPTQKVSFQTHTFAPVYDKNSKILILGTFPSVKSRENNFYYGHSQNRFWKVISLLTDFPLPTSIDEKKFMLIKNKIAIWDVVKNCEIIGSSDSSIKNVTPNDIENLIQQTNIKAIFANGNKASYLYKKYVYEKTKTDIKTLPSTSPANAAYNIDRLISFWSEIKNFI